MTMKNSQQQLRKLLEGYLLRVTALQSRFAKFVVSEDVRRFVRDGTHLPLLIIVADNPGEKEHTYREFLSGRGHAGKIARTLLEAVFGAEFLAYVLILNKSNYSTSSTAVLSKLLRSDRADTELLRSIRADQEQNGSLVRELATLLRIPVVTFGWEADSNTFQGFRAGHGEMNEHAMFRGIAVQQSQIVPHPSYRQCYGPIRGDSERARAWNARLMAFLERHKDVPALRTEGGYISERTLRRMNNYELWLAYFTTVILGANQST